MLSSTFVFVKTNQKLETCAVSFVAFVRLMIFGDGMSLLVRT
jgi:hypothetical protein